MDKKITDKNIFNYTRRGRRMARYVVSYAINVHSMKGASFFRMSKVTLVQRDGETSYDFESMLDSSQGELALRLAAAIEDEWKKMEPNDDASVCVIRFWPDGERWYEEIR